jgi:thiosulfate/3-mercaptopyruvate sulfurtransferase
MKFLTLIALVVFGFSSPLAAETRFGPLIDPVTLNAELSATNAPLILDIRGKAYNDGHIQSAISAPYPAFRGPKDNPGKLLPEAELETKLQGFGVTFERPVVVVHEGDTDSDFGAAARVYWTLKSSGLTQLAILNGGMTAWKAAELPLETKRRDPVPSTIDITFSRAWLADADEVASIVDGKATAELIDARPAAFFEGKKSHPAAARPGTLPGADNVAHSTWFDGGTKIVDAGRAAKIAAKLGLERDVEVVSFCNTGHWASTDWFALSELAGVPNVKLYPESMVGYSKTDHEMANVPGLLRHLYNQIIGN